MKNLLIVTTILLSLSCNTATDKKSEEAAIAKLAVQITIPLEMISPL